MAQLATARSPAGSGQLEVALATPGFSPLLRAGVGGLAASLRAIRRQQAPRSSWPSPVELAGGRATVEPLRVVIEWGAQGPESALEDLIDRSFKVTKDGLVFVVAMFEQEPHPTVVAAAQRALKRTFLQHGKSTTKVDKKGGSRALAGEVDGASFLIEFTPYSGFVHQNATDGILKALRSGFVDLAGWAYPGSAQRHIQFPDTRWFHSVHSAVSGAFAIAGTIQLIVGSTAGAAIVIPDPTDLVAFGCSRPHLTPRQARDFFVASAGDAALGIELALRAEAAAGRPGCGAIHVVTMGTVPWDTKQKYRVSAFSLHEVAETTLDLYDEVAQALPARIIAGSAAEPSGEREGESYFVASALRGFLADNIALGRPWYEGFSTAKVGLKTPRYLHYTRDKDNRGALYPPERKSLMSMLSHLAEAEASLVRSVHTALRQRFGAIASETQGKPAVMRNRFTAEKDNWRLKFAGSKTPDQVRGALADLWSRAGSNAELQASWPSVLDLLRKAQWQLVRDLALVALASYSSKDLGELEPEKPGDLSSGANAPPKFEEES